MTEYKQLTVQTPSGSYPIFIGYHLLDKIKTLLPELKETLLITDTNVAHYYQKSCHIDPLGVIIIQPGEANKQLVTIQKIYNDLIQHRIDRTGTIVSLGGGVVGDISGFAAATYMRGIPFIQIPTTILSMVDASIGGKTGVDLAQGKNLVGAFKQPEAVIVDLATLFTLPNVEIRSGLAEVVKHAILSSPELWALLSQYNWEEECDQTFSQPLLELITQAILVKKEVVEKDPFEKGIRAHLNLGHTFAHAIEQVSHYKVRHGEAVAIGLVAAAHLSATQQLCAPELQLEIEKLLRFLKLPTRIPNNLPTDQLLSAISRDKKKQGNHIRFILLQGMQKPFISSSIPEDAVRHTLDQLKDTDD